MMGSKSEGRFLTVAQAADELQVSRWMIYRLIWDGKIRSVEIGRCRRIVRKSFEAYCSSLTDEVA